jgi:hypothetical protein
MRNVLVKLLVKKFELTKIDTFIGVMRLLHKAYLEKMLRIIVSIHIKPPF